MREASSRTARPWRKTRTVPEVCDTTTATASVSWVMPARPCGASRAQADAHFLLLEIEIAPGGQHDAVSRRTNAPSSTAKARRARLTSGRACCARPRSSPGRDEAERARLLHDLVESPMTKSVPTGRPSQPSTPMVTARSMRFSRISADTPRCAGNRIPHPRRRADVHHEDGIRLAHRARRQQRHHDIPLGVKATRDAADQGQLQLLGAAEIVLGQRNDRHARRLDDRALGLADHRWTSFLRAPDLPRKTSSGSSRSPT